MPSMHELGRIAFYRGYSACPKLNNSSGFVANSSVNSPILPSGESTSPYEGGTTLTTPIFSYAYTDITKNKNFMLLWNKLFSSEVGQSDYGYCGRNNISTTINDSNTENYGYNITSSIGSDWGWISGISNSSSTIYRYLSRFYRHQGIPCVQFNYSK
jgi:hypothetical protein